MSILLTVQCVPQRYEYIKGQINYPETVFNIDKDQSGAFNSFANMLNIDLKDHDYRLHLQDDLIIPNDFWDRLPKIEKTMQDKGIHVLSLFAPNRKALVEKYNKEGEHIAIFDNFLWLQCCLFSKKFIELMKEAVQFTKETKHDDCFVAEVLKANKIKAYVYLPSLVQHNTDIKSTMGHANNVKRQSPIFIQDLKK